MEYVRINAAIDAAYAAGAFPCAAVLVEPDEGEPLRRFVGKPDPLAEAEGRSPRGAPSVEASEDTVFDLASLTKPLATSLVALKAIESGALDPGAPLGRYLPEAAASRLEPTIRQVMAHSAGLPPIPELQRRFGSAEEADGSPEARARAIAGLLAIEPDNPPGTHVAYSCTGFLLLGIVLERLGGARLSELFAREVARPLGLGDGASKASGEGSGKGPVATFLPGPSLASRCAPTEPCAWRGRRIVGEVHDESSYCLGGDGGNAGLFANLEGAATLFRVWRDGGGLLKKDTVLDARACLTEGLERRRGLGIQLHDGDTCDNADWPIDAYGHTGFTGTCAWRAPGLELGESSSGDVHGAGGRAGRRGVAVVSLTNRVYGGRDATVDGIVAFRQALHGAVAYEALKR